MESKQKVLESDFRIHFYVPLKTRQPLWGWNLVPLSFAHDAWNNYIPPSSHHNSLSVLHSRKKQPDVNANSWNGNKARSGGSFPLFAQKNSSATAAYYEI